MKKLNDTELRAEVVAAGWTGADRLIAFQVALAESDGDADALNRNMGTGASPKAYLSVDQGLWQINEYHKNAVGYNQVWACLKYGGNPGNAKLAYNIWKAAGGNAAAWTSQWNSYRDRANNPRWGEFTARSEVAFSGNAPVPYPADAANEVFGVQGWKGSWRGYRVVSAGYGVTLIQKKLGVTANGSYDTATESAVKLFQSKNSLEPHGVVGTTMWAKLGITE